jgi:murein DD-endopeptidase MepM/ murein hydrolase activator NlpD
MINYHYVRLLIGLLSIVVAVFIAASDVIVKYFSHDRGIGLSPSEGADDGDDNQSNVSSGKSEDQEVDEQTETDETLQINKGDTLSSVLKRSSIDDSQITDVLEKLKSVFNPRDLRPDHELFITYMPIKENGRIKKDLIALHLRPSLEYEVHVEKSEDGAFVARKEQKDLTHDLKVAKGVIENSLFIDAGQKGVPQKILHEMMQVFIHLIDFQRDFHPGDQFGVVYHTAYDPVSLRERPGEMLYATLILGGKEYKIYRHKYKNGTVGYFNEKGESIKKGLLRTPIDGARISSLFGNRRHPILGYTKAHKGVDFAAPTGTPIMASGDGVVEKIGPWGAYGNYIRIRHNNEYSTAYAHLSRFAKNLRSGVRVRQGQTIGFVGTTGRASGPHLHYELIRFNQQINPKQVTSLPAMKLAGKDMQSFLHNKDFVNKTYISYEDKKEESQESVNEASIATESVSDEPVKEASLEERQS